MTLDRSFAASLIGLLVCVFLLPENIYAQLGGPNDEDGTKKVKMIDLMGLTRLGSTLR